jgi:DNA invertase Pin-like site-specific DNA recombinase
MNKHNLAPELKNLLNDTQTHKFDAIIVKSPDRFSRDTRICIDIIYNYKIRANIDVISTNGSLDTRQQDWKLTLSVLGACAEHKHEMLSQRAKQSWAYRKAKAQGA